MERVIALLHMQPLSPSFLLMFVALIVYVLSIDNFIYIQEYEVSNLYDSSLALPDQDEILQPVMHILREDNSEGEDFDVSLPDSERYKLVDDMSEDFTVDPADLQESTDSDNSDVAGVVSCN